MKTSYQVQNNHFIDKEDIYNKEKYCKNFNSVEEKCLISSKLNSKKENSNHLAEWMKDSIGNSKSNNFNDFDLLVKKEEISCLKTTHINVESSSKTGTNRSDEINWCLSKGEPMNLKEQGDVSEEIQSAPKASNLEKRLSVCRECHETCLSSRDENNVNRDENKSEDEDERNKESGDTWGSLMMLGICGILPTIKKSADPFELSEPPSISVLPPTPDKKFKNTKMDTYSSTCTKCNRIENDESTESKNMPDLSFISPLVTRIKKSHPQLTSLIDTEDDDTADEEPPYKTLSSPSGLRRFGTLNSLEKVNSEDLDQEETDTSKNEREKEEEEEDDEEENIEVKTHSPEVGDSIRGWTVRAGSFVAAKMAFFERLSSPDNSVTIRKTTFLERYLKPTGENNIESPDFGTNTSSSGKGEDEGETSGATSGEEVWGTPTSGGDFEEDHPGESSNISFSESPRGSIDANDDTEQLMEDLLISLPMMAIKNHGVRPRQRLEPLLEEDDSESSSAPCSPKIFIHNKTEQDKGKQESPKWQRDSAKKTGSVAMQLVNKNVKSCSNLETESQEESLNLVEKKNEETKSPSPSIFRKLGLKRNSSRYDCARKCNRLLRFLSGRKASTNVTNRNSATYGAKPLFRYLFNRGSDDDIPTTLPRGFSSQRKNEKRLEKRFWKQLRRRSSNSGIRVIQSMT